MSKKQNIPRRDFLKEAEEESFEIPSEDDPAFNYFIEWVAEFPEEAAKKYPWFYRRWKAATETITSWETALLFKPVIEYFPDKIQEINNSISSFRNIKLREQLELIENSIKIGEPTRNTIVKTAYERNKEALIECLEIVKKELLEVSGENTREPTTKKYKPSYIWQGDLKEVDILYSQLIKTGFIATDTEAKNFRAIFLGTYLNEIKPVQWLKKKNLLAYLIDQLTEVGKFPDGTNHWSLAEACFTNIKNLKQQRTNFQNNKLGKPRGYSTIDNILKKLDLT